MQWGMQYAVGMQYIVGVSVKRSTHTVDLANMGGGDCHNANHTKSTYALACCLLLKISQRLYKWSGSC